MDNPSILIDMASSPAQVSVVFHGHRAPGAGFESPFEMLSACHERVHRTLALLARLQQYLLDNGLNEEARLAAHDVMRYFDIAAPLHHQDEELHVFPPLLATHHDGMQHSIQQLLDDHRHMETRWKAVRNTLLRVINSPNDRWLPLTDKEVDAINLFTSIYERHIACEEKIAYPEAKIRLNVHALQAMSHDMQTRRDISY